MSENVNIVTPCQFNSNYTYYACGFFVMTELKYMTKLGTPNNTPLNTIFMEAMHTYRLYNGANGPSDMQGMSYDQTRRLLNEDKLAWSDIRPISDAHNQIIAALDHGYVCGVAVSETSVYDYGLGRNPYTDWNPAGTHAIIIVGHDANNNYIVRDSANCSKWILRQQPRIYSWQRLNIVDGYRVYPSWNMAKFCHGIGK